MTSAAPLIEELFNAGHPLDHVLATGEEIGWTRDDVMAVLRAQQWDLDGSGRLPRSKRITTPRGLRYPQPPAKGASGTPGPRTTGPVPKPAHATTSPVASPAGAERKTQESNPVGREPVAVFGTAAVTVRPSSSPETVPAPADKKPKRPKPTEHGTPRGLAGHKRNGEPVPDDDACGCVKAHRDQQAAYQRASYARTHPQPVSAPLPPPEPAPATPPPATAAEPVAPSPRPAVDALTAATDERPRARLADRGRRPDGRDLDDWLDDAWRSTSSAVRRAAARAGLLHEQLHDALDALVRAEHDHHRGAR